MYRTMKKLAKTYGPVSGFYVGPNQAFISVVGPQAVKEALHNDDLNGRPSNSVILARTFGEKLGSHQTNFFLNDCILTIGRIGQVWLSRTESFGASRGDSPPVN